MSLISSRPLVIYCCGLSLLNVSTDSSPRKDPLLSRFRCRVSLKKLLHARSRHVFCVPILLTPLVCRTVFSCRSFDFFFPDLHLAADLRVAFHVSIAFLSIVFLTPETVPLSPFSSINQGSRGRAATGAAGAFGRDLSSLFVSPSITSFNLGGKLFS